MLLQLKADELKRHIDATGDLLLLPWFATSTFTDFKVKVDALVEAMKKYHEHLVQQQHRSSAAHHNSEPLRDIKDNWITKPVQMCRGPVSAAYESLVEAMKDKSPYEPIPLLDYEPADRYDCRKWLEKMALPFPAVRYAYRQGNYCGNVNFVWYLPDKDEDRSDESTVKAVLAIKETITVHGTRQMSKELMEPYQRALGLKPAILRNMIQYLRPNYEGPSGKRSDKDIDERLVEFLLNAEDTGLVYDMRANNGRAKNADFDAFWEELSMYLDEQCSVHERRVADSALYLPFAISVQDLINLIKARLPEGSAIPSASLVRLQFWPANPYTNAAVKYTGRFHVKYAVQQRLLRVQHEDAHYCAVQFQLLKQFAVKYREHVTFVSEDDKAVIPVGEPGQPLASVARHHNRSLAQADAGPKALDHDFHISGLIPSVMLHIDVPEQAKESFYRGVPYVTLKDKVFEPSNPLRHAAEKVTVLLEESDGENSAKPILIEYTDGGPDHRSTYKSVQLAHVATFIRLDLDLLISSRTAPHQSYRNPAERIMSHLNLALQSCALSRQAMTPALEMRMKSLNSMKAVRAAASRDPSLKPALMEAVKPAMDGVKDMFGRLKRNEEAFRVRSAATEDDVTSLVEILQLIEPEITTLDVASAVKMTKWPRLQEWMDKHCRLGHYMVQVCMDTLQI